MFVEALKLSYDFSAVIPGAYLRYSNRALLLAEELGIDALGVNPEPGSLGRLIDVGLSEWAAERGVDAGDYAPLLSSVSVGELWRHVLAGIAVAMPEPVIGAKPRDDDKADVRQIRNLFCDVMGKSEDEFWSLTLREVFERWDCYAVFMGYKKAPERVEEFDD